MGESTQQANRGPHSPVSSEGAPTRMNPATIKGALLLAGGATILIAPDLSVFLVCVVVGVSLIIGGGADLWFAIRAEPRRLGALGRSVVALGAGVGLLVWPDVTVTVVLIIVAALLVVRGGAIVVESLRDRANGAPWVFGLSRGLFQVGVGALIVFIPESVVFGVVVMSAVIALIVGAIALQYGWSRSDDREFDVDAASIAQIVVAWIEERDVGATRREEVGEGLFFENPGRTHKLVSWWVMLILSVAIATYGIMQDSTAVVIGAMLIAPLMTPILGGAASIVNVWSVRLTSSLALVAAGVTAAIGISFVIGQWLPSIVPLAANSQVLSRVSPNMIDMMIALAAGAAGAYANVDKRVSSSIAGVAIAVALVPPLGVVGLTLGAGAFADSFGAFLLFLTNFVSIILSASIVFVLTGFAALDVLREREESVLVVLRTVVFAALLILVPLVFTAQGVLSAANRQATSQEVVEEWLGEDSQLRVLRISVDQAEVEIFLTGSGEVPPIDRLEREMTTAFGTPSIIRIEYAPTTVVVFSEEGGLQRIDP